MQPLAMLLQAGRRGTTQKGPLDTRWEQDGGTCRAGACAFACTPPPADLIQHASKSSDTRHACEQCPYLVRKPTPEHAPRHTPAASRAAAWGVRMHPAWQHHAQHPHGSAEVTIITKVCRHTAPETPQQRKQQQERPPLSGALHCAVPPGSAMPSVTPVIAVTTSTAATLANRGTQSTNPAAHTTLNRP